MTCSHGGGDCDQLINKYLLRRHGGPGVCMCMAGGRVPHGHRQRLPPINSCEEANACKSHLSAVTVITSPLRLMLQLYLGISAASISIEDAAFRSSMLSQEMEKRLEPVHLVVVGHLVPPPPDVVRQEELVVSGITNQLKSGSRSRSRSDSGFLKKSQRTLGKIIFSL